MSEAEGVSLARSTSGTTARRTARSAISGVGARTATGEERARLWELAALQWPDDDAYRQKTDREIPVVVLERD